MFATNQNAAKNELGIVWSPEIISMFIVFCFWDRFINIWLKTIMRNISHFQVKSHIYFQFRHIFSAHVFVLFLFKANINNADTLVWELALRSILFYRGPLALKCVASLLTSWNLSFLNAYALSNPMIFIYLRVN